MRARVLRAAAMAVGVGVCGLAISSPAFAVVATVPTPTWQTNGRVNVIVVQKNRVYIGGQFTAVRPPGRARRLAGGHPEPRRGVQHRQGHARRVEPERERHRPGHPGRRHARSTSAARSPASATPAGSGSPRSTPPPARPTAWHPGADAEVLAMAHTERHCSTSAAHSRPRAARARAHLAAFSTSTGALAAWSPSTDDQVKAMRRHAGRGPRRRRRLLHAA